MQEAFQQNHYVVPDYQREYVWEEREVTQLLEDIDDQRDSKSDHSYFIGMILVTPTSPGHFEVIDGQQRLTTFFLLLCALKYRFDSEARGLIQHILASTEFDGAGDVVESLKLDPRYEGASEVTRRLATLNIDGRELRASLRLAGVSISGSVEKLCIAYDTILRYLEKNFDSSKELKEFWGFVATNVVFIQISSDISSALKIFETINERGVGLSPMDLLKNLLFSNVKSEQFGKLRDAWKKVTGPLEKAKEKPLRFLRYFLMANYLVSGRGADGVIREDGIYDWLTARDNVRQVGYEEDAFGFVARAAHGVELYVGFSRGYGNDGEPSPAMKRLQALTGGAFSLHYMLLLAAAPLPAELFNRFVQQLETFLFFYIFTKTPTKELERSFSNWADELRSIAEIPGESQKESALSAFVDSHFRTGMDQKSRELDDALLRYSLSSMQRYRTVYLLSRIAERIDRAYTGSSYKGVQDISLYKNLEIEHILPDTPESNFRETWELSNGVDYDDYKLRLGNLTLLEKPLNVLAANKSFSEKLAFYAMSSHYMTSSLAQIQQAGVQTSIVEINGYLSSFEDWTADNIDVRQQNLVLLIRSIWSL